MSATPTYYVAVMLRGVGLSVNDTKVKNLAIPEGTAALENKPIDRQAVADVSGANYARPDTLRTLATYTGLPENVLAHGLLAYTKPRPDDRRMIVG
jgi:hypothetical protein